MKKEVICICCQQPLLKNGTKFNCECSSDDMINAIGDASLVNYHEEVERSYKDSKNRVRRSQKTHSFNLNTNRNHFRNVR